MNASRTISTEKARTGSAAKSSRSQMRRPGLPRYPERMAMYLNGDHTQEVSPAFADAVSAIGKRRVMLEPLTSSERRALMGLDLRWRPGPDGVYFWAETALSHVDSLQHPDFAWLLEEASALVSKGSMSPARDPSGAATHSSQWLPGWAQSWTDWAYRFASLKYDTDLNLAKSRNRAPLVSAARRVSLLTANLRIFLLEYLPQSSMTAAVRKVQGFDELRWLLPHELLAASFHGQFDEFRDDFWQRCCAGLSKTTTQADGRSVTRNEFGETLSTDVQAFLDFVAARLNRQEGVAHRYRSPFLPRNIHGTLLIRVEDHREPNELADKGHGHELYPMRAMYVSPPSRMADKSCSWISRDFPHLRAWEPFASEYIQSVRTNVGSSLHGVSIFVERYLANAGVAGTPAEKLDPECAKRPIADETGSEALLLLECRDRVPQTLRQLSDADHLATLRAVRDGFIPHILKHHCSLVEYGNTTLLPGYWNPFANTELVGQPGATNYETIRDAMPYRWVRHLRHILVEGPHFCNWTWAQRAQQSEKGNSADWFEVDQSLIDERDPDCVWRKRTTGAKANRAGRTFYEIWSPVRWVALLAKLTTALRTLQVRVLDSGESDQLRFDLRQWAAQTWPADAANGASATAGPSKEASAVPGAAGTPWVVNDIKSGNRDLYKSILAEGQVRAKGARREPDGWSNGVLRPKWVQAGDSDRMQLATVLYMNTNKTADSRREGAAKGFEVPLPMRPCPLPPDDAYWTRPRPDALPTKRSFASARLEQEWLDDLAENIHWWLAKLRDWQAKYNPIKRRVQWKELDGTRLIPAKSDEQFEMYRPACFLFREPSMNKTKKHPGPAYPLPDNVIANAWWKLLKALQDRLNDERTEGQPEFRLVRGEDSRVGTCVFDLHSIRVSIITALIVDGKVPVQYVQALVGHSRIVMTIYYTKINPLTMMREIAIGFSRASEAEVEKEREAIQNATVADLRATSVFNDAESAMVALGVDRPPSQRNVVMWVRKLGGICPVGGVTHDTEGGMSAGCFNGGPLVSGAPGDKQAKYAPVEGGPGTCVNCRWFLSRMPFIGELQAIGESASYRAHEFKEKTAVQAQKIEDIRDRFESLERKQGSLSQQQKLQFNRELDAAEAVRDGFVDSAALDLMIAANAFSLISRLASSSLAADPDPQGALIANGTQNELRVVLEQTDSAMLHAVRVSLHAEVHPEIIAPAASMRAARVLARKLQEEDLDPFELLSLPEELQARAVNSIARHIASLCDPANPNIGLSKAAALLESARPLSEITGVSPLKLRDWVTRLQSGQTLMPAVTTSSVADLESSPVRKGGRRLAFDNASRAPK